MIKITKRLHRKKIRSRGYIIMFLICITLVYVQPLSVKIAIWAIYVVTLFKFPKFYLEAIDDPWEKILNGEEHMIKGQWGK